MTKQFTPLQLFSIIDGRLSTDIGDVYDILNHVCDDDMMTHHLPVAKDYLLLKNPKWVQEYQQQLDRIKATLVSNTFETVIGYIKDKWTTPIDVPQLRDETNTSDYGNYMIENSLLLKKLNK